MRVLLLIVLCAMSLGVQAQKPRTFTLPLNKAELGGAVRLNDAKDTLIGWKDSGAKAEWLLNHIKPGQYEIHLTYSGGEHGGGTCTIERVRNLPRTSRFAKKDGPAPDRRKSMAGKDALSKVHVHKTKDWKTFKTVRFGQLQLGPGERLRISNPAYTFDGLFRIRAIKLVPAQPK